MPANGRWDLIRRLKVNGHKPTTAIHPNKTSGTHVYDTQQSVQLNQGSFQSRPLSTILQFPRGI
jgi:hypothetical protein